MKIRDIDEETFARWLEGRPQIHDLAARVPPGHLYKLTTTGQLVEVMSYSECGRLRVYVNPDHNPWQFVPLEVYGIDPADLVDATEEDCR